MRAAAAAARLQFANGPAETGPTSKPIALPSVSDACALRDAGIHALEVYTPRNPRLVKMGSSVASVPHPPIPLAWLPNPSPLQKAGLGRRLGSNKWPARERPSNRL